MTGRIVDIRNRPAFLHDFYGARRGTPEFGAAKWLNGRTGSEDPEHFVRSQTEDGYIDEIRSAGIRGAGAPFRRSCVSFALRGAAGLAETSFLNDGPDDARPRL